MRSIWRSAKRRLWHRRELRIYWCPASRIAELPRSTLMRRDAPEDLEFFERTSDDQLAPEEFRRVASQRLAQGHHLYTLIEQGLLVRYAWLIDSQERGEDAELGQVFFPPPRSAALYDDYTHPSARGRGLHFASICQRLHDAKDLAGAEQAYTYIYSDNLPSMRGAEKAGFECVGRLISTKRFGIRRRYAVPLREGFRAGLL
jgi:RimJ/RimL family protein N-acetyltransferase